MVDVSWRVPFRSLGVGGLVAAVLLGAAYLGSHVSDRWLVLLVAVVGALMLLRRPVLGLFALIVGALLIRFDIGTGTEVKLNLAALLVPALLGLWLLDMVRRRELRLASSLLNKPLWVFLFAGLFSLLVGIVTWDAAVPRSGSLIIVQLAQWALFAFSVGACWLMGNLVCDKTRLKHLTFFYLAIAGGLAILRVLPGGSNVEYGVTTFAVERSPFWMLLMALASGQLLFNEKLSATWRLFLLVVLAAILLFAFVLERQTLSHLAGVVSAAGMLAWLRWPRWRWAFGLMAALTVLIFSSALYQFVGGNAEWEESGGSRLALIGRVVEVTMRNPVTGLGPAAYRSYARMKPLAYGQALWVDPQVNSHNNYVDLFAHMGLVGLAIFFWFSIEVVRLCFRLRRYFVGGFEAGYLNAMLAAWVSSLVLMLFADWILPHVYNIGFPGFQASVLVWLFLGGLVSLEQVARDEPQRDTA
jgi:hypothetical protein